MTRCHETQELIRTRQTALMRAKYQLSNNDCKASNLDLAMDTLSDTDSVGPLSPSSPQGPLSPLGPYSPRTFPCTPTYQFGRRRSLGAIPACRTNAFNFGYSSLYKESMLPEASEETGTDGGYSSDLASPLPTPGEPRCEPRTSLHDIKELRESAEDLLNDHPKSEETSASQQTLKAERSECSSVSSGESSVHGQSFILRRPKPMLRSNTWDFSTESDTRPKCPLVRRGSQSSSSTDEVMSKDYSEER